MPPSNLVKPVAAFAARQPGWRMAVVMAITCAQALGLSACAYVTRGNYQDITIAPAQAASGAEPTTCTIGEAETAGQSASIGGGTALKVKRSSVPLVVRCSRAGKVASQAELVPAGDMVATSFILGGLVSGSIDYLTGAGYTYPDRIYLTNGESLKFVHGDGTPVSSPLVELETKVASDGKVTLYYRPSAQTPLLDLAKARARKTGKDTASAERLAESDSCQKPLMAALAARGAGYEIHKVTCAAKNEVVVRCEMGVCGMWDSAVSRGEADQPAVR